LFLLTPERSALTTVRAVAGVSKKLACKTADFVRVTREKSPGFSAVLMCFYCTGCRQVHRLPSRAGGDREVTHTAKVANANHVPPEQEDYVRERTRMWTRVRTGGR
jgi:hypothetical protein